MKNDTSSQIFLFSTSPKIYFPSTESQTIKTPPKMTLKGNNTNISNLIEILAIYIKICIFKHKTKRMRYFLFFSS